MRHGDRPPGRVDADRPRLQVPHALSEALPLTEAGAALPPSLADWTAERIDAECEAAYDSYFADVRRRHIAYFAERPERRSDRHPFAATSRESALPEGWEYLTNVLPPQAWHRHHLSGASSQMLTLALLVAAIRADPSLQWIGARQFQRPLALFEVELAPHVLNERPRQTSIDCLVLNHHEVVAVEAKFTERGLGKCSCELRHGGLCSKGVLERCYWSVASRDMVLERARSSCSLSLAYQAVRNVAAAQAIAGKRRRSSFLLLYDVRNPYFAGAQAWPGWIKMLSQLMTVSRTAFVSLSWQELLARLEFDASARSWAREKHGLFSGAA
jgi:hypothetical protein